MNASWLIGDTRFHVTHGLSPTKGGDMGCELHWRRKATRYSSRSAHQVDKGAERRRGSGGEATDKTRTVTALVETTGISSLVSTSSTPRLVSLAAQASN